MFRFLRTKRGTKTHKAQKSMVLKELMNLNEEELNDYMHKLFGFNEIERTDKNRQLLEQVVTAL